MRNLLLTAIVLGFTSMAVFRPHVGILFFTWLAFFYPQSYAWSTLPLSQIVAAGTMAGWVLSKEAKGLPLSRESILLLCLWGIFGFSTLFAFYPDLAFVRLMYVSKILLMVFLTMVLIKDRSRLDTLLRVIAFSIGFIGLKGAVFVLATGGEEMVWGPEGSFLRANNIIGLALVMNIPLLYYLAKIETRPWLRKITIAMLWGSYPAVICTYSRGAWLGLVVVTGLLFLRIKRKLLALSMLGLLAVIGATGALSGLLPERLFTRYEQLENYQEEDSAESRFWSWEFCRRIGFARPLTGGGFDFPNWRLYREYYPEFAQRWGEYKTWSCHSSPLSMFGEHGFPGMIVWLSLLACCFGSLRSMGVYGKFNAEYAWLVPFAVAIRAALVAYLVVGTFIDAAYFDMLYYVIALVIIAKEIVRVADRTKVLAASAPVLGARMPARAVTR
jgi:probable O-glycosylation ligase (exosortase A-associated)